MSNPLQNLDDALAYIDRKAIHTTQGSYIKVSEVKEVIQQLQASDAVEKAVEPKPKNMNEAKQMVKRDGELMKLFPPPIKELGKSVPAMDPDSVSRP